MKQRVRQFQAQRTPTSSLSQSQITSTSHKPSSSSSNISQCSSSSVRSSRKQRQFNNQKIYTAGNKQPGKWNKPQPIQNPQTKQSEYANSFKKKRIRDQYKKFKEVCTGCMGKILEDKKVQKKNEEIEKEMLEQKRRLEDQKQRTKMLEEYRQKEIEQDKRQYQQFMNKKLMTKKKQDQEKKVEKEYFDRQRQAVNEESMKYIKSLHLQTEKFKEQIQQQLRDNKMKKILETQQASLYKPQPIDNTAYIQYRLQESKRYQNELHKQMEEKRIAKEKEHEEKLKELEHIIQPTYTEDFIKVNKQGHQQLRKQMEQDRRRKQQEKRLEKRMQNQQREEFRQQEMENYRRAIEEKEKYTRQYIDELSNQIQVRKQKEKKEKEEKNIPVMVDVPQIKPQEFKGCENCDKKFPVQHLVPCDL